MSNAGGSAAIREMVARCRALADLPKQVAPMVAREAKAFVDANIRAGLAPDGSAWAPKKDGGLALRNGAKAVVAQAVGTVAQVLLHAPEVFHHFGAGGKPVRKILPGDSIPEKLGEAIRRAAIIGWEALVKKKGRRG